MKPHIILIALVFIVACTAQYGENGSTTWEDSPFIGLPPIDGPLPPFSPAETIEPTTYPEANNQFAIDLYKQLKGDNKNLFFSPWSIFSALSMVYEGADGNTATEIAKTLYLQGNESARRAYFAAMQDYLNAKKDYTIENANAFWIDHTFPVLSSYKDVVKMYYGGEAANIDFISAYESVRAQINTWVEEKTHGKITDLLPKGSLSKATRAVLVNAIYFKGSWTEEFDEKLTKDDDFYVAQRETIKAPTMRKYGDRYNYGENELLQIIELPYKGENLSMIILLPKAKTLDDLEEELSASALQEWKKMMWNRKVDVFIPKFKLETRYGLNDTLSDLGMKDAFREWEANFTKMYNYQKLQDQCSPEHCNIFISNVIHKAYIDVNEEGTEAAAATAITLELVATSASPPAPTPQFRVDHPFIFLIQERTQGNILFMGNVVNPK